MNFDTLTFIVYTFIATATTIVLGQTLYNNGVVFLHRIFITKPLLVNPINKLLLTGFYLMNLGFVLVWFVQKSEVVSLLQCLEFLSSKLGVVYLVLGVMHLFNILVFVMVEKKLKNKV